MGFVGPVSRLGERLVRPHDVTITLERESQSIEALVLRVVHLGFEVRVELSLPDGSQARAQLTRGQTEALELDAGDIVYVRPPQGVPIDDSLRGGVDPRRRSERPESLGQAAAAADAPSA
jgi:sulfate transport system ATP-binding protein